MQSLKRLNADDEVAWYAVEGDHQGAVERFLVTTRPSRAICNRPEILGMDFNLHLQEAIRLALGRAPFRPLLAGTPEDRLCVVHFLRGGLNFELRRALWEAFGFNRHASAFMSSQRYREDGRWQVREDLYRKLQIPKDAVLVMGDVVATGATLENGLQVVVDHLSASGSSIRALVCFTIGCHKAEKVLEVIDARMRRAFPSYERTVLTYLEGKFRLVDSRTPLRIALPGTDLVRWQALLAPEFERSQYEAPPWPLERCAVYDAGSRAFDIPAYTADVVRYWEEMARLARGGWTLAEALLERWPDGAPADPAAFREDRRARWPGVPLDVIEEILARNLAFWRKDRSALTSDALLAVCQERLSTLRTAGGLV